MNDLDQQRATEALVTVKAMQAEGFGHYGKYVSYVKSFPVAILQNGLGQALAGEFSNKGQDSGHKLLFEHVCKWLKKTVYYDAQVDETMLQAIMDGEQQQYTRAQHEAVAYLAWLKKFAVAMLEQEPLANEVSDASNEGDARHE